MTLRLWTHVKSAAWFAGALFVTGQLAIGLTGCTPSTPRKADVSAIPQATPQVGIVGGTEVALADPIAAMTAIMYLEGRSGLCTVSILNSEWVLSAAHCADGKDISKMEIVFALNPGEGTQVIDPLMIRRVVEVQIHPRYSVTSQILTDLIAKLQAEGRELTMDDVDAITDWGDVSLLRLDTPIPASSRAAELLPEGSVLTKGQNVILAGYGITASFFGMGIGSGTLRKVDVQVAEPVWGTTEVLFDQTAGRGACHGDSGGPSYVDLGGKLFLFGVTSRGVRDPQDTCMQFAAYTNISAYRSWIKEVTGL